MTMTRAQYSTVLIFLKEAATQIDTARVLTDRAADRQTKRIIAELLRDLVNEIMRLELLRQSAQ